MSNQAPNLNQDQALRQNLALMQPAVNAALIADAAKLGLDLSGSQKVHFQGTGTVDDIIKSMQESKLSGKYVVIAQQDGTSVTVGLDTKGVPYTVSMGAGVGQSDQQPHSGFVLSSGGKVVKYDLTVATQQDGAPVVFGTTSYSAGGWQYESTFQYGFKPTNTSLKLVDANADPNADASTAQAGSGIATANNQALMKTLPPQPTAAPQAGPPPAAPAQKIKFTP